ncbi:MerR family transcriptional regulator [Rhizohabitans arisaemae]|uniref:MerR family transcriptional regulator n=1 Tax=Rhizohabitans arisaemae TaxID=2720610 RepID=UPI0024B1E455|nr:MerR family transcriptional regulator [Rhizohabitans arisaemae]
MKEHGTAEQGWESGGGNELTSQDLVSIGELARSAGVSCRTIRYYEELGILPEPKRSPGGTRKYPSNYRAYLETALSLKELGFSLEEIKLLKGLTGGQGMTGRQYHEAVEVVTEKMRALEEKVATLRRIRDTLRGEASAHTVPAQSPPVSVPNPQNAESA